MVETDGIGDILAEEAGSLYIPETPSFLQLRAHITHTLVGKQHGHVEMAYSLLSQTLYQMYGSTDIPRLVSDSRNMDCVHTFTHTARRAMQEIGWAVSSTHAVWAALKAVLAETAVGTAFVTKMSLSHTTTRVGSEDLDAKERMLVSIVGGNRYARMSSSRKARVADLITTIRRNSRNKSKISIRGIISFWLNTCYPTLGLDLDLDAAECNPDFDFTEEAVKTLCGNSSNCSKRFRWLQLFITHVLGMDHVLDVLWLRDIEQTRKDAALKKGLRDGSDIHRFQKDELEALYTASRSVPRDYLMYILMITTGMRVGGLSKIRTSDVVAVKGAEVTVRRTGRTLEKGSKWFTFVLAPVAREPLVNWVKLYRPASNSEYLFPSKGGVDAHISTNTLRSAFGKMCRRAGLEGEHLHPHSLRHSFAHILLEVGNDVDKISKLLGHSSSEVTEKYYLRESASEVAKRANIPWLTKESAEDLNPVPEFLTDAKTKKNERKKQKLRKKMARLDAFASGLKL